MKSILFRYRSRQLDANDIAFVKETIARHYNMGRSHISRVPCEAWAWKQPNGKLKECATRDILLRLEERGLVKLPPRIKPQKNNRTKTFDQIPLFFVKQELSGLIRDYKEPKVRLVRDSQRCYLWDYFSQNLGCVSEFHDRIEACCFYGLASLSGRGQCQ